MNRVTPFAEADSGQIDHQGQPTFWWVNQGSTYKEAIYKEFIWAPKEGKTGSQFHHWLNVSRVKAGDIIFHYADSHLRAISKAKTNGYSARKELGGDQWSEEGWRVDIEAVVLSKPIVINAIGPELAALNMEKGPINRSGSVNQGYLFELTQIAAQFLFSKSKNDPALISSTLGLANELGIIDIKLDLLPESLYRELESADVLVNSTFTNRMLCAILSKQFLIFTGLAGSGKTKLAQAFARWICPRAIFPTEKNPCYALVPVGADWIGNENIVGYPNGLDNDTYITKPALELICHALANPTIPHFLILDEMNLSHVERYFADLLSAIESGEEIPLYEGKIRRASDKEIPQKLRLPGNLFIIGTVNVDETTYMFSPKVLDRANVIEFRMEPAELATFLANPKAPKLADLDGKGAMFGEAFVQAAADRTITIPDSVKAEYEQAMLLFFNLLRQHNAEFGYRVAYEAVRFIHFYKLLGGYGDEQKAWFDSAMDAVIVQKFLPKLHGSRSKLEGLLWALAWACAKPYPNATDDTLVAASQAQDETKYGPEVICRELEKQNKPARYPLSFAKVMRMWRKLIRDQFVTFAEA